MQQLSDRSNELFTYLLISYTFCDINLRLESMPMPDLAIFLAREDISGNFSDICM